MSKRMNEEELRITVGNCCHLKQPEAYKNYYESLPDCRCDELQKENARLKKALNKLNKKMQTEGYFVCGSKFSCDFKTGEFIDIIQNALNGKE